MRSDPDCFSDGGLDGELYSRIVRAAKACDPSVASDPLRSAIAAGSTPGAAAFSAVVVACTNLRDLEDAEAWLHAMRLAGHGVSVCLVRTMAITALQHRPQQRLAVVGHERLGPVPTLEDVGRWLRRLHAEGTVPLSADIANEVVTRLGVVEMDQEACEWAAMSCCLALQELWARPPGEERAPLRGASAKCPSTGRRRGRRSGAGRLPWSSHVAGQGAQGCRSAGAQGQDLAQRRSDAETHSGSAACRSADRPR